MLTSPPRHQQKVARTRRRKAAAETEQAGSKERKFIIVLVLVLVLVPYHFIQATRTCTGYMPCKVMCRATPPSGRWYRTYIRTNASTSTSIYPLYMVYTLIDYSYLRTLARKPSYPRVIMVRGVCIFPILGSTGIQPRTSQASSRRALQILQI